MIPPAHTTAHCRVFIFGEEGELQRGIFGQEYTLLDFKWMMSPASENGLDRSGFQKQSPETRLPESCTQAEV